MAKRKMAELEKGTPSLLEGYEYARERALEQERSAAEQYDSDSEQRLVITNELQKYILAKDRSISWMLRPFWSDSDGKLPASKNFVPNPTIYCISRVSDIKSVFKLFLNSSIMDTIVVNTNIEGRKLFGDDWTEVNEETLEAYIGLLILSGVFRSRGEPLKRLWSPETGRNIFRAAMPMKEFLYISRALRFESEEKSNQNKDEVMGPIKEIWDKWVELLPKFYTPGNNLTISEQIMGDTPVKEGAPTEKPPPSGIRVWSMCDNATSYVLKIEISPAKILEEATEKEEGTNVISSFTQELKYRHITCDNYFTSYRLGQLLLRRKLTLLGKIRWWAAEFPVMEINKEVHSTDFYFTKDTTLSSYVQKRNKSVLLMSTKHKQGVISDRDDRKPVMMVEYEDMKKTVRKIQREISRFSCRRKTTCWASNIFHHMVDVSAYNSFIIWTRLKPNWRQGKLFKRRTFLEELGQALILPYMASRKNILRDGEAMSILKNIQDRSLPGCSSDDIITTITGVKRGRCRFCPKRSDNRTSLKCDKCEKYVCESHTFNVCHDCKK